MKIPCIWSSLLLLTIVAIEPAAAQSLVNLSSLAQAGGATPLTSGFVIANGASKTVLVRAVGPTLTSYGVSNPLPNPTLQIFQGGAVVASNTGWGGGSALANTFTQVGAFSLPANSLDSALVVNLPAGQYSAQVTSATGATGPCLLEIYDVSGPGSQLINLSTLLPIAATPPSFGFVISSGSGTRELLVRAVGPSLSQFGVTGLLADPTLTVVTAPGGQQMAQNSGWTTGGNTAGLLLAMSEAGAFPLLNPSADAAVVTTFSPGNYSVIAGGANGSTGTALVEIYDITPTSANVVNMSAGSGSGSTPGTFTFTRAGDLTLPLTVTYGVTGSAYPGTDYATLSGAVTIPAGSASAAVPLTLYPSTNPNPAATVVLSTLAGTGYSVGPNSTAMVTFTPMAATLYTADLRPSGTASGSTASGTATILVGPNDTIGLVSVNFSNLSSPEVIAHLEIGTPGQNPSYVLALSQGQVSDQVWTFAPTGPFTTAQLAAALQSGQLFVEVDTSSYPSGELTGGFLQVTGSQTFSAPAAPPTLPASALGASTDATNAMRLLSQASFGATTSALNTVMSEGVTAWINSQLTLPATSLLTAVDADATAFTNPQDPTLAQYYFALPVNLQAGWWKNVLTAPDQLRQRVAFALSEILVTSQQGTNLNHDEEAFAKYYDTLAGDAFGNFRQLLQDVTLSPIMGTYLSTMHNEAGNAALGTSADENYAREVQQLFTIGLNELNPDGTLQLSSTGQPIPTYDQTEITNTAKVFTGWAFASPDNDFFYNPIQGDAYATELPSTNAWLNPMQAYSEYHDITQKTIVNGVVIAAGGTAQGDLQVELDTLFNHQNTGPFICRELIQRLVTSNPSPGYVYRVAQVFANDGTGTRGNLGAVVKAILTDYEARSETVNADAGYGKLREPLIRTSELLRGLNVTSQNGRYVEAAPGATQNSNLLSAPMGNFEQEVLDANTVFNFFAPSFIEPGPLASAGLVAPEFQITDAASSIEVPNVLYTFVFSRQAPQPSNFLLLDLTALTPLASNPAALVSQLSLMFCDNQMSAATQSAIVASLKAMPASATATDLVESALYLTVTCSESAIER